MLSKEQLAEYLRRPLTSLEDSNYETYIDNATQRLALLLCFTPEVQEETPTASARTFDSRDGYRTVWIDPLTTVTSVKVDGEVRTDYVKKQNDSYQGSWFNIIEFDERLCGERVEVTGTWGFGTALPADLAQVLAGLFVLNDTEPNAVKRKEIEDFKVEYRDGTALEGVIAAHGSTLVKYAQCERAVTHGRVDAVSDC